MIFLQIHFNLNVWWVIIVGVVGSILGRYILTLYIPSISVKIFKQSKNEDIQFLGKKMQEKGWKSQAIILAYSLLPLPTTPLFLAAGIAKLKPIYIIPAFFVGKFTSDAIMLHLGKYALQNAHSIMQNAFSFKSIASFVFGLVLLGLILFVDWRTLIQKKKLQFHFKIFS